MRLATELSGLGRALRSRAQIKVRQPLREVVVMLPARAERESLTRIEDQLREELNVKSVRAVTDESAFRRVTVRPNLPRLGKPLGSRLATLNSRIQDLDDAMLGEIAARVRAEQGVEIGEFSLDHRDLLVDASDRPGFLSGMEGAHSLALDTTVTLELAREGIARELVRHLQELRRSAGLDVSDRITAYVYRGGDDLEAALADHSDYIQQETLATQILQRPPTQDAADRTINLEGQTVTIGVEKLA